MERVYANVWTRFAALVIDSLLVIPFEIPYFIFIFRVGDGRMVSDLSGIATTLAILSFLSGIVFWLWNGVYRMGRTGQSLGRQFLHIIVLNDQGRPIGVGRAFLREVIGRWISGLICYIGYLNAFWDARKQMWHDKIADCFVYYVDEDKELPPSHRGGTV
ncbi:MAG: RDD family protein [bacterium]|nr:RDD family protein [bacterium]